MTDIFKRMFWLTKEIKINGNHLSNLRYGDDVVIIAAIPQESKRSENYLQEN